jgi:hypothetical protein
MGDRETTRKWEERFEKEAADLEQSPLAGVNPRLRKAQVDAMRSMAKDLRDELEKEDPVKSNP